MATATPARYPARPMQRDFVLEPADTERLANLAGPLDAHLRLVELRLGVEIANRGNVCRVSGEDAGAVARAESRASRSRNCASISSSSAPSSRAAAEAGWPATVGRRMSGSPCSSCGVGTCGAKLCAFASGQYKR